MMSSVAPTRCDLPENYVRRVDSGLDGISKSIWNGKEYGTDVEVELRLAAHGDQAQLACLYEEAFPEYPYNGPHTEEYHTKGLENRYNVRMVAELDGGIVGAAALDSNPYCLRAELKQVVVMPEKRSLGISNGLVGSLTDVGRKIGLELLYAEVRTRQPRMQRAFHRHGYRAWSIIPALNPVHHKLGTVRENMIIMVNCTNNGIGRMDTENIIIPEVQKDLDNFNTELIQKIMKSNKYR